MKRLRFSPRPSRPASPRTRSLALLAGAAIVVAGGVTGGLLATAGPGPAQYTAYFSEAVGVYPGSDVDILGVKVGTIDSVQPQGRQVKVVMSIDSGIPVPAGVDAVVIVPSVVADRYIQLTPPYTRGPQLSAGASIPQSHTATPVEIDELYAAVTKFAADLGPNGVNQNGALSDVLNTGAANLKGNGAALGTMIRELSQLYQTLQGSQGNFFGTITNLQKFTAMLDSNNGQVAQVQNQLAQVSQFLAVDRQDLGGALDELATALGQVQGFVANNRSELQANISKLEAITQLLANQRASLAESLDNLPLAADNFVGAYDPSTGTLAGRGDLNEIDMGPCAYPPYGPAPGAICPNNGSGQAPPLLPLPAAGVPTPAPSKAGTGTGAGR
jgi:phospholipid/cholesterol/gamma-HCH transport system substrate-binding protein